MLNKEELIAVVAEKSGESKAAAARVLDALQSEVIDRVAKGEEVRLSGFASFTPAVRAARTARNPQTGAPVDVPETKVVRIHPLKKFKDAVRGL